MQLDLSNNLSISGKLVCDNIFSRMLPPMSFDTDRGWNIGGDKSRAINDPVVLIKSQDIADNAILPRHIADRSIPMTKLMNFIVDISSGSIDGDKIADSAISTRHLAYRSVSSDKIGDGAILTRHLAYRSVLSDKIADNMIIARHIADMSLPISKLLMLDNSISGNKIADRSISMSKLLNFIVDISNGSITSDKIATLAIATRHIIPRSVVGDCIADDAILSRHIPDRSIPMSKLLNFVADISNGSITSDKIADNTILSRHIADFSLPVSKMSIPDSSISGNKITNLTVSARHIADNAILARHIPDRSIPMSKLLNFVADISNGAITSDKIADNAISSRHIPDRSIPMSKLLNFVADISNGAITSDKIADNAILTRHIPDFSLPVSKLSIPDSSISGNKITNLTVSARHIADDAILSRHIPDRSIPMSKLSNFVLDISNDAIATRHVAQHAIITEKIADGAINSSKISPGTITSDRIADGAIRANNIADGSIVSDKIPNENVITAHLANQAITTNKIADLGITAAKIASGAITTDKITGGAINSAHIAYKSVTGDRIADTSIGTAHIQPNAITEDKMNNVSVFGRHIADGAITTSKIANGAITLKQLDPDILLDNETNVINNQTYTRNATIDDNAHHFGSRRICMSSDGKCLVASGETDKSVYVYRSSMNVWNTSPVIIARTEVNFGKYVDMSSDGSVIATSDGITVWIYNWCVADFRWELQPQTITSALFSSGLVRNMRLDSTGRRILIASHYTPEKNGIATYSVSSGALAIGIMNNQNTNGLVIGENPEIAFSADANTVVLSDTSYLDDCGGVIIFDLFYGIRDRVETSACFTGSGAGNRFGNKIAMNSTGSTLAISSASHTVAVYTKQTPPCTGWLPTRVFGEREISRGIAIDSLSVWMDEIGKSVFIGYNGNYVAHAFKIDNSWSKVSQITNSKRTSSLNMGATNRDATSLVVCDFAGGGILSIYDVAYEPILITSSSGISLMTGTAGRIMLDGAGNVGIGTAPVAGNKMYVAGNINATGAITGNSDGRLKERRETIENATETLLKLCPQIYLKKPDFLSIHESEWQRESGFVAQDVWHQTPELRHLVGRDVSGNDEWGETPATMNYIGIIPYLVRCIQEQDERIRKLETRTIR